MSRPRKIEPTIMDRFFDEFTSYSADERQSVLRTLTALDHYRTRDEQATTLTGRAVDLLAQGVRGAGGE